MTCRHLFVTGAEPTATLLEEPNILTSLKVDRVFPGIEVNPVLHDTWFKISIHERFAECQFEQASPDHMLLYSMSNARAILLMHIVLIWCD